MKLYKLKTPILAALSASVVLFSCTKLEEKLNDSLTFEEAKQFSSADGLLKAAYNQMQPAIMNQFAFWSMSEHSSDELVGPTRASDWDDNGRWRKLHAHTFDATLDINTAVYQALLINQYNATNVLNFDPSPTIAAEARFIRAYTMYCTLSGWGQLPFRDYNHEGFLPEVFQPTEAVAKIISELEAILPTLPPRSAGAKVANKDAARFLLMKCYLNKGMFINRAAPTFDAADMAKVISYADAMEGTYALNTNYYDIFGPNNRTTSTESIFVLSDNQIPRPGYGDNVSSHWFCTLHYNTTPGGWNGFTTLSDFYDKFENVDTRKGAPYAPVTPLTGMKAGFLLGPQVDKNGAPIIDANTGTQVSFTREVNLQETTVPAVTQSGIRGYKYTAFLPDNSAPTNDYIFFRYADVLLMKAEAQLRSGNAGGGLTLVNQVRTARGATTHAGPLTNDIMLDERGRELWWEGWRREDQLRFGTFLAANQLKGVSDAKYLLFPIPVNDIAANPNLKQNAGYE